LNLQPHRTSNGKKASTWVFGTTEILTCINEMKQDPNLKWSDVDVQIVTPSTWSKRGFVNSGVDPALVHVVPHGVDTDVFYPVVQPSPEAAEKRGAAQESLGDTVMQARRDFRARFGWDDESVVFLSVGSRTGAKGMPDLIETFQRIQGPHPQAKLLLKLQEHVYNESKSKLTANPHLHKLMESGAIAYVGDSLSSAEMAGLYRAADVYVSPYRGEGFNIPVLEAMACGLLMVLTKGGAPEDFVPDEASFKVVSELKEMEGRTLSTKGKWLVPSTDDLFLQMQRAIYDTEAIERAQLVGPAHVRTGGFTWTAVVEKLLAVFRSGGGIRKKKKKRALTPPVEQCTE
jgi:glycosyltransferase involved in cell wall biosynthesis